MKLVDLTKIKRFSKYIYDNKLFIGLASIIEYLRNTDYPSINKSAVSMLASNNVPIHHKYSTLSNKIISIKPGEPLSDNINNYFITNDLEDSIVEFKNLPVRLSSSLISLVESRNSKGKFDDNFFKSSNDGERIFILLKDYHTYKDFTWTSQQRIFVNADLDLEHMKGYIRQSCNSLSCQGYTRTDLDSNTDSSFIEEGLYSDCYFLVMRNDDAYNRANTNLVYVCYHICYKYTKVPKSFKTIFDKYYDDSSLFKVNLYTDPEVFNECESAVNDLK